MLFKLRKKFKNIEVKNNGLFFRLFIKVWCVWNIKLLWFKELLSLFGIVLGCFVLVIVLIIYWIVNIIR